MINPVIVKHSSSTFPSEEGCLSLSGTRIVNRYESVTLLYLDTKWRTKKKTLFGFEAAIVQHEIDHLNGKLI